MTSPNRRGAGSLRHRLPMSSPPAASGRPMTTSRRQRGKGVQCAYRSPSGRRGGFRKHYQATERGAVAHGADPDGAELTERTSSRPGFKIGKRHCHGGRAVRQVQAIMDIVAPKLKSGVRMPVGIVRGQCAGRRHRRAAERNRQGHPDTMIGSYPFRTMTRSRTPKPRGPLADPEKTQCRGDGVKTMLAGLNASAGLSRNNDGGRHSGIERAGAAAGVSGIVGSIPPDAAADYWRLNEVGPFTRSLRSPAAGWCRRRSWRAELRDVRKSSDRVLVAATGIIPAIDLMSNRAEARAPHDRPPHQPAR